MLWEETGVGKGFGLNCRTEVQELTLIGRGGGGGGVKKCLRAETRRKHKFTRIRNTTARVFLVVTGQSLGDKGLRFNGLLAEITRLPLAIPWRQIGLTTLV